MNTNTDGNKAQRTEDRAIPEGLSEDCKERSASSATNGLSKASRERDEAVDKDTANETNHRPPKKTKNDDDDDNNNNDDDRSSVAASSSSRNIATVTLAIDESKLPIRANFLANHSHPNVDKRGLLNMDAIVAKVRDSAVDYHEIEKANKPFLFHAELYVSATGEPVMRLPYDSPIALEKFRGLNSFSSRTITQKALTGRLYRGQNIDGLAVRRVDSPLFCEDVGFVDEDAERLGRRVVAAYTENLETSFHFTKMKILRPDMDVAERLAMIEYNEHGFFTRLTQEDCDWANVIIEAIMALVQCQTRSSSDFLSGSTVLDTPTKLSVDFNELAAAIIRIGGINHDRIFMISGSPSALRMDGGYQTVQRKPSSGAQKNAAITLLRNDPDEGTERHVVSVATRELVRSELRKLNFILKMCVNVESIHEQRDYIVNMYNAVHKMDALSDKASLVGQVLTDLARRAHVQFDEKPIAIAVLEFLHREEEVFGKNVAWLLGAGTENA